MKTRFKCSCGRVLTVSAAKAGKRGKCPQCGQTLTVPQLSETRANPDRDVQRASQLEVAPTRRCPSRVALLCAGATGFLAVCIALDAFLWPSDGRQKFSSANGESVASGTSAVLAESSTNSSDNENGDASDNTPHDEIAVASGVNAVSARASDSRRSQEDKPSTLPFQANRKWWICSVEIEKTRFCVIRMRVAFRNAQELAKVKYGIGKDVNGWDVKEGMVVYLEDWGTDEAIDEHGLPNRQVTVTVFCGNVQQAIASTMFRLDGEQAWTQLADYVRVVEGEPDKFSMRRCQRCLGLLRVNDDKCENCGGEAKQ